MRACVWIAIAGALSGLGCGGSAGNEALFDEVSTGAEAGAGGVGARPAAPSKGGQSGAPAAGGAPPAVAGAGSSDAGAAGEGEAGAESGGASASGGAAAAGAPTMPPGPECTGAFAQLCPAVADCLDPGKRQCVGGKWSACACVDECKAGEGSECTTTAAVAGVKVCGDDRKWQACYPAPTDWPAHVLCHYPKSNPEHVSPGPDSEEFPVCILSCFFAGDDYREDKMRAKVAPLGTDHCVLQPADHCWRCP